MRMSSSAALGGSEEHHCGASHQYARAGEVGLGRCRFDSSRFFEGTTSATRQSWGFVQIWAFFRVAAPLRASFRQILPEDPHVGSRGREFKSRQPDKVKDLVECQIRHSN